MKAKSWFAVVVIIGILVSCSEKEHVANLPPVADFNFTDDIDKFALDGGISTDPEGHSLTYAWTTTSDKVKIANPGSSKAFFNIPVGTSDLKVEVALKVSDGKNSAISTKTISVPPLTQIRAYGLGRYLQKEVSNDLAYEWYLDQGNTGSASLVNCGPTSVTMSIKWDNNNFVGTPESARNAIPDGGGWWYTNDIINYLNQFNVSNHVVAISDMSVLTNELDQGNILILCLDMYYIESQENHEYRFSKFYATQNKGWGHFIVAKGYKNVDGRTFLEFYDPYSFDRRYLDNSLMGKNRYYKGNNIDQATNVWWDYAIVIAKGNTTGGKLSVNPDKIIHMPGR